MRVMVTGGAGFIGSHTVVALAEAGHTSVVVDNLSNSSASAIDRIGRITGSRPDFVEADIRDRPKMTEIAREMDACIHFAALKAVGESVAEPLRYYDNNVSGTIALVHALSDAGTKNLVFSSSATVYGDQDRLPFTEDMEIGSATNPYGSTKIIMEQVLRDVSRANPEWSISLLRYFNPVGAHESGLIGEDPSGVPTNLMPYVARTAAGIYSSVKVFGNDYPTPDGTGVRDYIHVMDLAEGHLRALEASTSPGVSTYNLGRGEGHSVLEVIHAFELASGVPITYTIEPRRPGDVAESWASVAKAEKQLGWSAVRDLDQMCRDSWNHQVHAR